MRPILATFAFLSLAASQMAFASKPKSATPAIETRIPAVAMNAAARTVLYHPQDIVAIRAKMRYTTLIAVPPTEKIMEAAVGDKDYWIVDVVGSFCFIHPAKAGISSNLNLITNKGNIYSFTLQDVTGTDEQPDLKVMIEPADKTSLVASSGPAQYVPAAQVEEVQHQLAQVEQHIGAAVDEYKAAYPLSLKFDYEFKKDKDPFEIQSIYHDDRFTYIKTTAPEKFSVYDMKDGKPNLVNYQLREGTYIIPTVLQEGYVQLGEKKMTFKQKKG